MEEHYHQRSFCKSPLFKIVYHHYDTFQEEYERYFEKDHGKFRDVITFTINSFIFCGDPRVGVAKFSCPTCDKSVFVPFSCKTRLFCPSCHEKRILVWVEEIKNNFLLPVHHRFWTFSIPKRLRPYFKYNRKLLGLLIQVANTTFKKYLALNGIN